MFNLHRLGLATARHPWRTLVAWVLVIVATGAIAATWGGELRESWDVPGTRAHAGAEQLEAHFPDAAGSSAQVVLHDDAALDPALVDDTVTAIGALDHVVSVAPRVSEDADTALLSVRYDVATTHPDIYGDVTPLEDATDGARDAGVRVELGGELPGTAEPMEGRGEIIGVLVALALLVLTFGSVVAAGLPILTALIGLAVGTSLVTVLAALMDVSATAPTIATMVGLGVGIDYALLLVTRHVAGLRDGLDPVDAAARATATAGRAVIGAGLTVLVSLMGLRLAGLPTYDAFGLATALAVIAVMLTAVTVVPALCAKAGRRLLPRAERRGTARARREKPTWSAAWAARVSRRPVVWGLVALTVLVALAAPALGMRTWPQDGGSGPTGSTLRQAHDLVAAEFGPGANGPLTVVVDRTRVTDAETQALREQIDARGDVALSGPVVTSPDGALAVWDVEPVTAPTETATTTLLDEVRAGLPDGVEVTGYVPLLADISDMLADRLWVVIGFVVLVSVLLLTVMFRSVVVPLKAAVMNLLSIAAAYGVLTLVFQHGWGVGLVGLDHAVPVSSWVPILMFAVLFGLSMDYEVFLLSAVREDWQATRDATGSVVRGLASTGRVISMAAAIMIAVFLGFATEPSPILKMVGVGMAVAIALDATLVRMVLVPATMTLLGHRNWWFPGRRPAVVGPTRTDDDTLAPA